MHPGFFDMHHPLVPAVYFAVALCLSMACMHPVLIGASLLGALLYRGQLSGPATVARSLAWQLPLLAIIALLNPVFVASGSTLLGELFGRPLYLEAFVYGACMGGMLVAVMQWASAAGHVLDSDKVMALTARRWPILSLMLTMVMRLIPQNIRRYGQVDAAQSACSAAHATSLRKHVRQTGVLFGWSLEDSLESADAMRARAWGSAPRRSSYSRHRFAKADAVALCGIGALVLAAVVCAVHVCGTFTFFPALAPLPAAAWCVPHALLMLFPCAAQAAESIAWRRS